jgi:DNA-binding MarR family transcriptional regulator
MNIETIAWALNTSRLGGPQRLVLIYLANFASSEGIKTKQLQAIADKCGYSITTVRNCVISLEKLGLVKVERSGDSRNGLRAPYRIFLKAGLPKW